MILLYTFASSEDPAVLSKLLWQAKMAHQVRYDQGQHTLWLFDATQAGNAQRMVRAYCDEQSGSETVNQLLQEFTGKRIQKATYLTHIQRAVWATPISCGLVLLSIVISLLVDFGSNFSVIKWLYFLPVESVGNTLYAISLSDTLEKHQYWRLLTPAFIHFSVMHLCFNLLWMWDIGRKVEQGVGSVLYFLGVLFIAIVANYLQYFVSQTPLFGGMSGVVYGVIGFAWLLPKLLPTYTVLISGPMMALLMVFFVLGYTQFFEMVGVGAIANTAHLTGLLGGCVLAFFYSAYRRHI